MCSTPPVLKKGNSRKTRQNLEIYFWKVKLKGHSDEFELREMRGKNRGKIG